MVICVLRFHRLHFHYTVYHFVVSGSCVGLTHEAFVLFQESLWSHCCKAILSVVECYTVLCIVLGNHWRHQLHLCCLSLTAVGHSWRQIRLSAVDESVSSQFVFPQLHGYVTYAFIYVCTNITAVGLALGAIVSWR